jgi:hypothetical protein
MAIKRVVACAVLSCVAFGCGSSVPFRTRAKAVRRSDIGNAEAMKIVNFMRTRGGVDEDHTDKHIDEAILAELDNSHACFDMTIQSDEDVDLHLFDWIVAVNGVPVNITVHPKVIAAIALDPTAEMNCLQAADPDECQRSQKQQRWRERLLDAAFAQANVLGHRELRACAALQGPVSRLVLSVELVHPGDDAPHWGEKFEWQLH